MDVKIVHLVIHIYIYIYMGPGGSDKVGLSRDLNKIRRIPNAACVWIHLAQLHWYPRGFVMSDAVAAASVYSAPPRTRQWFDSSSGNEPDDEVCLLTLGDPFRYTIPTFDVLAVELRQVCIRGYADGEERVYDAFIRNDSSLCRSYPTGWRSRTALSLM